MIVDQCPGEDSIEVAQNYIYHALNVLDQRPYLPVHLKAASQF
jgi:hypothetical protein